MEEKEKENLFSPHFESSNPSSLPQEPARNVADFGAAQDPAITAGHQAEETQSGKHLGGRGQAGTPPAGLGAKF